MTIFGPCARALIFSPIFKDFIIFYQAQSSAPHVIKMAKSKKKQVIFWVARAQIYSNRLRTMRKFPEKNKEPGRNNVETGRKDDESGRKNVETGRKNEESGRIFV